VRSSWAFFIAQRQMARFRSTAIFSPWASVLFRFAPLPLGFPSLFPSVDWFPPHASFGAPSLSFFALLLDLFSFSVSFFSALFARRQSLVSRSSKKCFCASSLACARHALARPVFRIIAFTSSPNAHNLLIWSVLR
jgi:hypothetical protein